MYSVRVNGTEVFRGAFKAAQEEACKRFKGGSRVSIYHAERRLRRWNTRLA